MPSTQGEWFFLGFAALVLVAFTLWAINKFIASGERRAKMEAKSEHTKAEQAFEEIVEDNADISDDDLDERLRRPRGD